MSLSPEDRRRYGRQIRLVDIGEAGQAKLCAFETTLGAPTEGFARTIEERYARGAGLRVIEGANSSENDATSSGNEATFDAAALGIRHEAARDVAEGAWRALVAIRAALFGGQGEPPK